MKKQKFEISSIRSGDETLSYFIVPDTSVCIYKNDKNEILLVKQYRPIFDDYFLEVPGGSKDCNETIKDAAIREFREETGYVVKELELKATVIASIGASTEKIHIFKVISIEDNEKFLSEDNIEVIWLDFYKALKIFSEASVVDAKTLIALQYV
jgi:ADP-ribose pyrophosphatase